MLFDQGVPLPLSRALPDHEVSTAYRMGWSTFSNGELLAVAENAFDALVTTDQNLRHQQNLTGRRLVILVLSTTNWSRLEAYAPRIAAALEAFSPGSYLEVAVP